MTPAAASETPRGTPGSQAFPRSHRLKRRRLIRTLFDRSRRDISSVSSGSLRALYRFAESTEIGLETPVQIGVFVSRRAGGAVRRNRIRRQVREAYRRRHHDVVRSIAGRTGTLTLGLVFRGDPGVRWPELAKDTNSVVDKLIADLS